MYLNDISIMLVLSYSFVLKDDLFGWRNKCSSLTYVRLYKTSLHVWAIRKLRNLHCLQAFDCFLSFTDFKNSAERDLSVAVLH